MMPSIFDGNRKEDHTKPNLLLHCSHRLFLIYNFISNEKYLAMDFQTMQQKRTE